MKNTTSVAVFSNMLRLQLIATALVTIGAFAIFGLHAGVSGFIGGFSVIFAAFFATKIANRAVKTPSAALLNLLKAELLKILIIIAVLFLAFKLYEQIIPVAMLAGMAATALISGAAIGKLDKTDLKI
jgi:ATP synthase protein I